MLVCFWLVDPGTNEAAVALFAALASVTGMPAASAAETIRCGLQAGDNCAIHVGAVLVVASPISKTAITAMQARSGADGVAMA